MLSQTGASQLDVIGHSEGGLELRYYVKNLGGGSQVARYVSLGTPQSVWPCVPSWVVPCASMPMATS